MVGADNKHRLIKCTWIIYLLLILFASSKAQRVNNCVKIYVGRNHSCKGRGWISLDKQNWEYSGGLTLTTVHVCWLVPGSMIYCTCCPPDADLLRALVVYMGFLGACSRGCQSTNNPLKQQRNSLNHTWWNTTLASRFGGFAFAPEPPFL